MCLNASHIFLHSSVLGFLFSSVQALHHPELSVSIVNGANTARLLMLSRNSHLAAAVPFFSLSRSPSWSQHISAAPWREPSIATVLIQIFCGCSALRCSVLTYPLWSELYCFVQSISRFALYLWLLAHGCRCRQLQSCFFLVPHTHTHTVCVTRFRRSHTVDTCHSAASNIQ